jgi:acyl-CoA dehydrogenase
VPRELGGWGSSLAECAEAIRQVAQQAPATALALVMPFGNAATTRIPEESVLSGSRASLQQGKAWIAEQARLGRILAVANSEPGAGGDLANTKTTAERGLDGTYRLSGRKSFATFGRDADYFLCAARRSDSQHGGRAVIDGFFIARDAAGLEIDDRWNPVGMRPTASVGLTLEQTPAEAILGYPGCLEGINARHWSTLLFAAVFLGVGQGALQEGIKNTAANAVWGRAELAECSLSLDAALGYLQSAAANEPWPYASDAQARTRRVKTFVARVAVETATKVAMISGGRAYTPQHPVFRYLCDALAGPLLRPPLPQAMDSIIQQLFPESAEQSAKRAAA